MEHLRKDKKGNILELCSVFASINDSSEAYKFLKDLCTIQEISKMAERWHICKLLHESQLSYRKIQSITGASLTTIGRISRFLKKDSNQGYEYMLTKIKSKSAKYQNMREK